MIRHLLIAALAIVAIAGVGAAVSPLASADPPYATRKDAAKDGRYNIPRGNQAYAPKLLDGDNDGIACESN
jgi:hypothetical protein